MNFTNDYIFARFERISFKLSLRKHGETDVFVGYFNLGKIPNLKALFPAVSMDIRYLDFIKTWKKRQHEKVYFELAMSQERSLFPVTDQHKRDTRVKIAALIDYLENTIWV